MKVEDKKLLKSGYLITPPPVPQGTPSVKLREGEKELLIDSRAVRDAGPLPNYSLSTVCPRCGAPTVRRACKVRCERCGFMWDCSEL